jgi:methylated-DNA-[protein]-cysteine S-methyltransferase
MPVYAPLPTSFGLFILTADTAGLCALALPGEHLPLAPAANRVDLAAHPLLSEAGRQLLAYLSGTLREFDLPLSIHGTAFQKQVWEQLRAIPYGQTRTYGEVAAQMGDRNKSRAVGGAAHVNPLAIIIPCHRMIGADGKMTGYGGGLPLKQALLELEGCTIRNMKKVT